jgi:hypothetical protein
LWPGWRYAAGLERRQAGAARPNMVIAAIVPSTGLKVILTSASRPPASALASSRLISSGRDGWRLITTSATTRARQRPAQPGNCSGPLPLRCVPAAGSGGTSASPRGRPARILLLSTLRKSGSLAPQSSPIPAAPPEAGLGVRSASPGRIRPVRRTVLQWQRRPGPRSRPRSALRVAPSAMVIPHPVAGLRRGKPGMRRRLPPRRPGALGIFRRTTTDRPSACGRPAALVFAAWLTASCRR